MKEHIKTASNSFDWSRADAMTEEQRHAAALADPDAQPLTQEEAREMKPLSDVKRLRIRLKLTQEEFGKRYGIPVTTLRDWEQGRSAPDQAVRSYMCAIEDNPEIIAKTISKRHQLSPA